MHPRRVGDKETPCPPPIAGVLLYRRTGVCLIALNEAAAHLNKLPFDRAGSRAIDYLIEIVFQTITSTLSSAGISSGCKLITNRGSIARCGVIPRKLQEQRWKRSVS